MFLSDVMVISPSWTTYKPQAKLAHHTPFVLTSNIGLEWKITPDLVEQVTITVNDGALLFHLHFRKNKIEYFIEFSFDFIFQLYINYTAVCYM